jgi:hypothetical protein
VHKESVGNASRGPYGKVDHSRKEELIVFLP